MQTEKKAKHIAKKIKDQLSKKSDRSRGPVTLYLDLESFQDFKKMCAEMNSSASLVIEDFVREFLKSK